MGLRSLHLQSGIDRRELLGATAAIGALSLIGFSLRAPAAVHFEVTRTPEEWRRLLGAERYAILREAGTEHAWTSPLLNEHRRGVFVCAGCALPLFSSTTKFESGTGWPSFYAPLAHAIITRPDYSLSTERTEVLCRRCGGHLGHLFDDGPRPTGLRYCMNGLALQFRPA